MLNKLPLLVLLLTFGCAPGFLNTGGTNDPRELIGIAHSRMKSNRVIGARNVLRRSIEQSKIKNDIYALAVSYNMMGFTYIVEEKDPGEAYDYYQKALEIINSNQFDCELIHNQIGFALMNEMWSIPENSCSYKEKAQATLDKVNFNYKNDLRKCEGDYKAISIAEERVLSLTSHLKCN